MKYFSEIQIVRNLSLILLVNFVLQNIMLIIMGNVPRLILCVGTIIGIMGCVRRAIPDMGWRVQGSVRSVCSKILIVKLWMGKIVNSVLLGFILVLIKNAGKPIQFVRPLMWWMVTVWLVILDTKYQMECVLLQNLKILTAKKPILKFKANA